MRLADADLLPVDYAPQAEAIAKYETELEKLLKDKQDEIRRTQSGIAGGRVHRDRRSAQTLLPPPSAKTVPPFMNFAPMKNAIELLRRVRSVIRRRCLSGKRTARRLFRRSHWSGQCGSAASSAAVPE